MTHEEGIIVSVLWSSAIAANVTGHPIVGLLFIGAGICYWEFQKRRREK